MIVVTFPGDSEKVSGVVAGDGNNFFFGFCAAAAFASLNALATRYAPIAMPESASM